MKKYILSLLMAGALSTAVAQIPNNDFEDWTKISANVVSSWTFSIGKVTKSTESHSGSYAIKLESDTSNGNEEPGVVLFGKSDNGQTFYEGFPLAARPDSLVVWMKYNVATGDTARIFVFTKKAGVILSSNIIKITQFANGYMRKAFKLNYTAAGTPDSAILGFACTDVFAMGVNPKSWMLIDDISFSGTTQNVPNPGFENWEDRTHYLLNGWSNNNYEARDMKMGRPATVNRTSDKATGNYAVVIQNVIQDGDTMWGETSTHPDNVKWSGWRGDFKMPGRKDTLYGLYKWDPKNKDSFTVSAYFWKNGMQVGGAQWISGAAQSTYKVFKMPLTYFDGMVIPDSGKIEIASSYDSPKGNSKLYIDNLNFNPVYGVGVNAITRKEVIIIYPNPASDILNIILPEGNVNYHASVVDVRGTEVKNTLLSGEHSQLNIKDLSAGVYTVKLLENGATVQFVKQ